MSNFSEAKKAIEEKYKSKDGKIRKTWNRQEFNEIATAVINDPDYTSTAYTVKGEDLVETQAKDVAGLRKVMIGSVAKATGADAAEVTKLVENHEFPTLPIAGVIGDIMYEYLETGKAFAFPRKQDLQGSIIIESKEETTKTKNVPNGSGTATSHYAAHRVYKAKSKCPSNLKKRMD